MSLKKTSLIRNKEIKIGQLRLRFLIFVAAVIFSGLTFSWTLLYRLFRACFGSVWFSVCFVVSSYHLMIRGKQILSLVMGTIRT